MISDVTITSTCYAIRYTKYMDTDQTSIIHGKACTKHSSVSLEPEAPINLHSSVKKCDTSSHVPREVVVAREDCGESECSNGTSVLVALQGGVVLKHTAAERRGKRGREGERVVRSGSSRH